MKIDQDEAKQQLSEVIASQQCLAFVGAGPVAPIYGSWEGLLKNLCQKLNYAYDEKIDATELAEQIKSHDVNGYFDELTSIFGQEEFIPRIYRTIIKSGFRSIVTTNFDMTLAHAAHEIKSPNEFRISSYPSLNPQFDGPLGLFHLHGSIKNLSRTGKPDIILSANEFEEGYNGSRSTVDQFLKTAFTFYHTCFIGYTFKEKQIQGLFEMSRQLSDQLIPSIAQKRKSFAFIEAGYLDQLEEDRLTHFGITPIAYKKKNKQHAGLRELLEELTKSKSSTDMPPISWDGYAPLNAGVRP